MNAYKYNQIKEILKQVENPFYWLTVMVKHKEVTLAEAGYIVTYGIKGDK